jgi:adenine deaminase
VADLLVIGDLGSFEVAQTITGGRVVARDGAMVRPSAAPIPPPPEALNSVHLREPAAGDFALRAAGKSARARVLTERGRGLKEKTLPVRDGSVRWQERPELALASVWHRHGRNDNRFAVLLAGSGLRRGALATTYAHDSHNLVVVGRDPQEMATAARALIRAGGGYVAVAGGEVRALAALPVAGLLADRPVAELAEEFAAFVAAAQELGVEENPMGLLTSLPLPVVPRYRPTDVGLVDVDKQELISVLEGEG